MPEIMRPVRRIEGEIRIGGDKSISHRALILASLCPGDVAIENLSPAFDCLSTRRCLEELGVEFQEDDSTLLVKGRGRFGLKKADRILDAGNSGTTARLLCGVLAGQDFESSLTGDQSLRKRPFARVIEPLSQMGAKISGLDNGRLPLKITGARLQGTEYSLPLPSAQVKSALLVAGLLAQGITLLSGRLDSRDHTERLLLHLGAKFSRQKQELTITGEAELCPNSINVPGDISSSMFFIVAALLIKNSHLLLKEVGLNPTRTGALSVLRRMGAEIFKSCQTTESNEERGNLEVRSGWLRATEIVPEEVPYLIDEIPALAVAATQAEGETRFFGVGELRVKETDRLQALETELGKMGAKVRALANGLEVSGPTQLYGADVSSHGDHRIAMALAVAGLAAKGETVIHRSEWADISFPRFFQQLEKVSIR